MVSVTRTIFSAASSTDEKTPQATAASMAPPSAGPSSDSIRSTLMFSTFAIMRLHSGLFAPPPQIFVLSIWMPRDFATSKESRIAKATPSRTAWVISSLVVSMVRPMKVPLASGLLCGERSPIRYGRKKTLFSPSFVMFSCSFVYSFVRMISSIHHLLQEAALSMHPIR